MQTGISPLATRVEGGIIKRIKCSSYSDFNYHSNLAVPALTFTWVASNHPTTIEERLSRLFQNALFIPRLSVFRFQIS